MERTGTGRTSRQAWTTQTHVWASDVDIAHLTDARDRAAEFGSDDPVHLVLEILAYADEEAEARQVTGSAIVTIAPDEISVADDGRGTDTRVDDTGAIIRKPVAATRDVRFYDADSPPFLPDGRPRRGMSIVAAACPTLTHENRRHEGSWSQTYRFGIPEDRLVALPAAPTTGTTITFQHDRLHTVDGDRLAALAAAFTHLNVTVRRSQV